MDAPSAETSMPADLGGRAHGTNRWILLCVLAYVALGTMANLHAWTAGPSSHLQYGGGTGDVGQSVWSLGVTPSALLHGRSVLTTDWLNAPWGYNLMANTSIILPAALLAPLTLLAGPVATFNVAIVLAFAGSATVTMLVLLRYASWLPAAFLGGLLAAFSPAMAAQGSLHLHLVIEVFPPLVLLALDEILVRQRRGPWLLGIGLGLLASAQLMVSAEVLVTTSLLAGIGVVALALLCRHEITVRLPRIWRSLAGGAAAFAVTAGYPLWTLLCGPWSVSGPVQSPAYSRQLASDLLSFVLPTSNQAIAPERATRVADRLVAGNLAENGSYLGGVLVLVLLVIVWRWRRLLVVQVIAIVGAAAALLSLGDRLRFHGRSLGIPLPFATFAKVPLLDSASASRFAIPVGLCAGLLLAVGLDRLRAEGVGARLPSGRAAGTAGLVVAAAALVWLVPAWPYPSAPTSVPRFFTGGAADAIAPGSTVLTYPMPQIKTSHDQAMVWQAADHIRWRLVGAYGHVPGADGRVDNGTRPTLIPALLDVCTTGATAPTLTPRLAREVRSDLSAWGVSTIVLTARTPGIDCAAAIFRRALGRPPVRSADALVYEGLHQSTRR